VLYSLNTSSTTCQKYKMKNAMSLLIISLMTVSCINLEGRLNVSQMLTAQKRGGFLNLQRKTVQIQPGNYQASLKVNSAKSFTLNLKADKNGESDILIPIKNEKEFSIPTNGNVIIRGSEIAQPFDLSGVIETNISVSGETRTNESCTIQRTENHCDKICSAGEIVNPRNDHESHDPRDSRPRIPQCSIVCRDVIVTFEGSRFVEYHNRYTQRNLKADLLDLVNKSVLASFSGSDTESDRINDYIGECR
jgi:hypothetical protein